MDVKAISSSNSSSDDQELEDQMGLRRGPWTVEEDITLINYIGHHGEGRWNSLARCAGLKRTGKSCRLRWLNYLRPDVRRGNITLEEQLLILELHSRWGNRWSKIAQHLPGRTDNEIKNYWRTRVQKHAKQLKCDVNSKEFKDTMRYLWMPRLVERIQASSRNTIPAGIPPTTTTDPTTTTTGNYRLNNIETGTSSGQIAWQQPNTYGGVQLSHSFTPENSSTAGSSESWGISQVSPVSELTDCYHPVNQISLNQDYVINPNNYHQIGLSESLTSPTGYLNQGLDMQMAETNNNPWMDGGDLSDNLWNVDDDYWFMQQQLITNNININSNI